MDSALHSSDCNWTCPALLLQLMAVPVLPTNVSIPKLTGRLMARNANIRMVKNKAPIVMPVATTNGTDTRTKSGVPGELNNTSAPLVAGEELTKQVFGDYVSVYNFKQSMENNATVPLYYENRIPELQLSNQNLNSELESVLERAELDNEEEDKLAREFPHEYDLITRDERLVRLKVIAYFEGFIVLWYQKLINVTAVEQLYSSKKFSIPATLLPCTSMAMGSMKPHASAAAGTSSIRMEVSSNRSSPTWLQVTCLLLLSIERNKSPDLEKEKGRLDGLPCLVITRLLSSRWESKWSNQDYWDESQLARFIFYKLF